MNKIAILTDSCCDSPTSYIEKEGFYEVPLQINYKDRSYLDRVEITPEEVYESLKVEIPKTSLPSGEQVHKILDQIHADGYTHVVCVCVSSQLSGTFHFVQMILNEDERFTSFALDTKLIALGAGLVSIRAKDLVDEGKSFEEICEKLPEIQKKTKVFFCIPTLEYLRAGGRIGLVTSVLGSMLRLAPVITCNEDGVYVTIAKAHGFAKGFTAVKKIIETQTEGKSIYALAIAHGASVETGKKMEAMIASTIERAKSYYFEKVGPALGVHTGPGAFGVGYTLD